MPEEYHVIPPKIEELQELIHKQNLRIQQLEQTVFHKNTSREITDSSLNSLVDKILENPNVNIRLLPDAIERPLYTNLIKIVLGVVEETLKTTKISFLNQDISIVMASNDSNEK